VIQVNGKLRGVVEVPRGSTEKDVEKAALKEPRIKNYLEGQSIIKTIFVPDKLINFVVR